MKSLSQHINENIVSESSDIETLVDRELKTVSINNLSSKKIIGVLSNIKDPIEDGIDVESILIKEFSQIKSLDDEDRIDFCNNIYYIIFE